MAGKPIKLKALVDTENNRVIFAESGKDFVDVLFSFLTMPMGTIIRLTRKRPPTTGIGCMNNLYGSVENLDVSCLRTKACQKMLLYPQNGAAVWCKNLKLKIDDGEPLSYFTCDPYRDQNGCIGPDSKYKLLSHYSTAICGCGNPMYYAMINLSENTKKSMDSDARDEGVFVKGLTRFVISDELQVMPASTAASFSLLSKLAVLDVSGIEERTFDIGVNEVLDLLKCSLASRTPLTETFLKHKAIPELGKGYFEQGSPVKYQMGEQASNVNTKICVRLVLSKSKKMVCYAEVSEDFVDLLFSFLTIPLGYVVKQMHSGPSIGCINGLYKSIQDLDAEKYLKSNDHKEILLCPKLAPGFGYESQPLGLEEVAHQQYFYARWTFNEILTTDRTLIPSKDSIPVSVLTVMDPKSPYKEAKSGGGFVLGPAMFTVTDELIIMPVSPVSGLSILNKLKVPVSDIEERVVHIGNEEATRLLVASLVSETVLTDAFIRKVPEQEYKRTSSVSERN